MSTAVKKVKAADTNKSYYPYSATLQVDGMTCTNCRKKVENAFNSLDGIYAAVDLEKKQVVVHMKEKLTDGEILKIRVGILFNTAEEPLL